MNEPRSFVWRGVASGLFLALMLPACGGATMSGVAAGKVGQSVSAQAQTAPQGAEVCALQEAIAAQPGVEGKPTSESCSKALKSDQLWRRAMITLGAYGETLGDLATGQSTDTAGRLEGARTGVSGNDWVQVEPSETAAREAVTKLVTLMETGNGDLGRTIQDAAPHVKTICDGLGAYLEAQTKSLGDLEKEAEKKRAQRSDRRCGTVSGGQSVCVGESVIDRYVYANLFGQAAVLESTHQEARDAVAGFCAAHKKLEAAAADGRLGKDDTYRDVVEAVKASRKASAGGDAKGKAPAKK